MLHNVEWGALRRKESDNLIDVDFKNTPYDAMVIVIKPVGYAPATIPEDLLD